MNSIDKQSFIKNCVAILGSDPLFVNCKIKNWLKLLGEAFNYYLTAEVFNSPFDVLQ